jgi:type I restriction enzyme R subunit
MARNEAQTRADFINPALANSGWGENGSGIRHESRILHEHPITQGRIQVGGKRGKQMIADYVLVYRGRKLAVIEAKKEDLGYTDGVSQAKAYAEKLKVRFTYSTNGHRIYQIDMSTGHESEVSAYPGPEALWEMTFTERNEWRETFDVVPFEDRGGTYQPRFYIENAVEAVLQKIADGEKRMLLTMATGTGKTAVAFQIAWKLFESRWNISSKATRRPRILFLADRNILANQAFNAFSAFPPDALVRIKPSEISRNGRVPKNGNVFFTIFQTFMSGEDDTPNFGQYPPDFFDFIVIDECHRGGANDESSWRKIMEYFAPAVQLGLTATPKRTSNVDTYEYFGEPVYTYSLKDGINDGFLTPFRVQKISGYDEYRYTPGDTVIAGDIELDHTYTISDFGTKIIVQQLEELRVQDFMGKINQNEKTLVFCASQKHAAFVRDLINKNKTSKDPNYCVRVTSDEGEIGDEWLRKFQDNDRLIPTVLTTSQKLSTGVDALNVRNIVLFRPINSMIEFKQIIGRGTRMFDGKDYFTIYDFVRAYEHFNDPDWDGDPADPEPNGPDKPTAEPVDIPEPPIGSDYDPADTPRRELVEVTLRDGKVRKIMLGVRAETIFFGPDGLAVTAQEFIALLFDTLSLPDFFASEDDLRRIWSDPITRRTLLDRLSDAGFNEASLEEIQALIEAEQSDLFDVLEYVAFASKPISRVERVLAAQPRMRAALGFEQQVFIDFVLERYIESGVAELDVDKLPNLLRLKYHALQNGVDALGGALAAREAFIEFQKYLYKVG